MAFLSAEPLFNSIALLVLAAMLAFMSTLYFQLRKGREQVREEDRKWKAQIEADMVQLKTQMSPLWAQVQSRIAAELHHPHPRYAEMDKLLERLETVPLQMSPAERDRLKELLRLRSLDMHPDITPGQRSSAVLMLGVMDKVLEESALKDNPPPFPDSEVIT